ncbi:hypothetical protein QOT17_018483 [Balamuthia mandrillaris]
MVAPRLEGYRWMGGEAAPGRSGYGRGGAVYLPPGGTVDNFKVTLAAIEKRILDMVKEGRPLIIGGDWNARVGKGRNGRGESTYNARGKVLVEAFKRLALSLPQLEEEAPLPILLLALLMHHLVGVRFQEQLLPFQQTMVPSRSRSVPSASPPMASSSSVPIPPLPRKLPKFDPTKHHPVMFLERFENTLDVHWYPVDLWYLVLISQNTDNDAFDWAECSFTLGVGDLKE